MIRIGVPKGNQTTNCHYARHSRLLHLFMPVCSVPPLQQRSHFTSYRKADPRIPSAPIQAWKHTNGPYSLLNNVWDGACCFPTIDNSSRMLVLSIFEKYRPFIFSAKVCDYTCAWNVGIMSCGYFASRLLWILSGEHVSRLLR